MILNQLQHLLQTRYDLAIPYSIDQFVTHDIDIARKLSSTSNKQEPDVEEVFIQQRDELFEFTLYLDSQHVAEMNAMNIAEENTDVPSGQNRHREPPQLDTVCSVVEGVSHAVCLLWHAHNNRQVRPVDLELQAEVDKYLVLLTRSENAGDRKQLHKLLFTDFTLTSGYGTVLRDRYRTANSLAARYCSWLTETYSNTNNHQGLSTELARFYRLSGRAKFEHIERLH